MALGDVDGNGTLDIAVGNAQEPSMVYLNDGAGGFSQTRRFGTDTDRTKSLALADLNGDGALDIAVGNYAWSNTGGWLNQSNAIYMNDGQGNFDWLGSAHTFGSGSDPTTSLAIGDMNGDGWLDIVVANDLHQNEIYLNDGRGNFFWHGSVRRFGTGDDRSYGVAVGDIDRDGALDVAVANEPQEPSVVYRNTTNSSPRLADSPPKVMIARSETKYDPNAHWTAAIHEEPLIPIRYKLYDADGDAVRRVRAYYSPDGGRQWRPALASSGTMTRSLPSLPSQVFTYTWDTAASGFFGQSDNVVVRIEAHSAGPGPFLRAYTAALTEPFRVRGTQVRVLIDDARTAAEPAASALVYRSQTGQVYRAEPLGGPADPFRTKGDGFLQGQDELMITKNGRAGDKLVALWPTAIISGPTPTRAYLPADTLPINLPMSTTITSELIISDALRIADVSAWVSMTNTQGSDLRVTLFSPDGTSVPLITGTTSISGFMALAFDQVAPLPASSGVLTGNVRPAEPLSDLKGQLANGAWTLKVENRGHGAASVLVDWGLALRLSNLFYTSATPTATGLDMTEVQAAGVQTLTVSTDNPLLLFNLDVALEWDARNDPQFLSRLQLDLQRASEFLYDWTNGQAALGRIDVYHDAKSSVGQYQGDPWSNAAIRIYATNRMRPSASQGGVVTDIFTDTQPLDPAKPPLYGPGQVHMGATWNRFGESSGNLGEDWPRTLAHELGHYLFFLDDNYLGVNNRGVLITIKGCPGAMADQYRDDFQWGYGEFHSASLWPEQCDTTLSNLHTGRSDWETIRTFYPSLKAPMAATGIISGPTALPLDVTQVRFVAPNSPANALAVPVFYLADENGTVQPGPTARAFLFKADTHWLADLGRPQLDQVVARGAAPGDRVCVFDTQHQRLGCKVVTNDGDTELRLRTDAAWQPQIAVSPVTSSTIAVKVSGVPGNETLHARLFPQDFPASQPITLTQAPGASGGGPGLTGTFSLTAPAPNGHVYVWAGDEATTQRRIVTDYALGGRPGFAVDQRRQAYLRSSSGLAYVRSLSGLAYMRALSGLAHIRSQSGWAYMRSLSGLAYIRALSGLAYMRSLSGLSSRKARYAPAVSTDGQVMLFGETLAFGPGQFVTLQAATSIPEIPPWATLVGQAYRLEASDPAINLDGASISFGYLGSEVPPGEEPWLRIYYRDGQQWEPLHTELDPYYNYASAQIRGEGPYALMSTIQIPLDRPGWNLVSYPVVDRKAIAQALRSIDGQFTAAYTFDPTKPLDPWKVYDPKAPAWANDLETVEFGQALLIHLAASHPITLQIKGAEQPLSEADAYRQAAGQQVHEFDFEAPPATYYGAVLPGPGIAPQAGMPVSAWIDHRVCGRGETREVDGQVMYQVKVLAAGTGQHAPCGAPGKTVVFKVGNRFMLTTAPWDNSQATERTLSAVRR